jgi:hypothetical protein
MNDRAFNRTVQGLLEIELEERTVKSEDAIVAAIVDTLLDLPETDDYLRGVVLPRLVRSRVHIPKERPAQRVTTTAAPKQTGQSVRVHPQPPERHELEERIVRIGSEMGPVSQMKVRLERTNLTQKFWEWKEFDPARRLHIALPEMTRQQLEDAARYRLNEASANVHNAAFLRSIAAQLGPRETVKDRFNDHMLTELWKSTTAFEEITTKTIATAEPIAIERTAS